MYNKSYIDNSLAARVFSKEYNLATSSPALRVTKAQSVLSCEYDRDIFDDQITQKLPLLKPVQ